MPEIIILLTALAAVIAGVPAAVVIVRARRKPPAQSEHARHLEKFIRTGDWDELDRALDEIGEENDKE